MQLFQQGPFERRHAAKTKEKPKKATQWQRYIQCRIGKEEDDEGAEAGISIQEVAAEKIEAKALEKELQKMKYLLNTRFGPDAAIR